MAGLPDYMTDPNAVLKDADVQWRHGQPPDYSKTRKVFEQSKKNTPSPVRNTIPKQLEYSCFPIPRKPCPYLCCHPATDPDQGIPKTDIYTAKQTSHEPGSLPDLVQNLVKNWEIEASFKTNLRDWRTVDPEVYTFAVNGGSPQPAEHMLKVGTYNAIIGTPNAWYSPRRSDLASSHKTFKRMMPTFAWEVLEVYGGPPVVAFKWRHWGEMKEDYVSLDE